MSHLISQEGFDKLKEEWHELKYVERPAVQARVTAAAAEGDRSENAEYTFGRMRIREIDRRLRFLDKVLDTAKIVEQKVPEDNSIRFGATVTLKDTKCGKIKTYRLVGPQEIDPLKGNISVTSPVGKELIAKHTGEKIKVTVPKGVIEYEIVEVVY